LTSANLSQGFTAKKACPPHKHLKHDQSVMDEKKKQNGHTTASLAGLQNGAYSHMLPHGVRAVSQ